ncbi:DUF6286 domain-containing protein [Streptomyces sp. NPDC058739]|uniref:DUF6286 domain-containing protein n=1 Tax=Streptomyces sp. NPDC058739 TaxID=3346618 RepID=UPI00369871D2
MSEPRNGEGTTRPVPVLEKPPAGHDPDPAPGPQPDRSRAARRFWSARRVPSAVAALLLLVVAGFFLYDIAAVRAGRSAMQWRDELAAQLAERPLDDTWVLVGAGVAAALGLWLLVLAVTPGLRELLPMRRSGADVRAGLDRAAAAMVLRDRAMQVSGVQSVRVRAGRRRAEVRAVAHFRPLEEVRQDLDAVLDEAVRALGLARPLALSVRVRRPGRKG